MTKTTSGLAMVDYTAPPPQEVLQRFDFIEGDESGLAMPAHAEALRVGGEAFLTKAFRVFGALDETNSVARIVRMETCPGGSTGSKLLLSVEYERAAPDLHTELFVKFSRDFDDARRDRGRFEMQSAAPFTALARNPAFPIRVPRGYFADFHADTGTGLVITERVRFGEAGIEPHRRKALDHLTLGDPLPYYQATVTSLARLAGAHKSGRVGRDVDNIFPFDPSTGSADPIRYDEASFRAALATCIDFITGCPQLFPEELRSQAFLDQLQRDAVRIFENEQAIQQQLCARPDLRALCHWNAHIDNAWFWRDGRDALHCGLLDWGRVGNITMGSALWGSLSAAGPSIWEEHLDDLLELFLQEHRAHGGPTIELEALQSHLTLHIAAIGVSRVLALPEMIRFRLPECAEARDPHDPMFVAADSPRTCLLMFTNFLRFQHRRPFGRALDRLLPQG